MSVYDKNETMKNSQKITITLEQLRRLVRESASDFSQDPSGRPFKLPTDPEELDYYWFKNELWEELKPRLWRAGVPAMKSLVDDAGLSKYGWDLKRPEGEVTFFLAFEPELKYSKNKGRFYQAVNMAKRKVDLGLWDAGARHPGEMADRRGRPLGSNPPIWGFPVVRLIEDSAYKYVFDFDDDIVRPIYDRFRRRYPGNIHKVCNDMAVAAVRGNAKKLLDALWFSLNFVRFCKDFNKEFGPAGDEDEANDFI